MSNSRSPPGRSRNGNYEVGYRKPPLHSRYKPGHSGNPKGRPARPKTGEHLLRRALNSTISVIESGVPRQMTQQEVMFKALLARAIKGEPRAVELVVKLMEQHGMMKDIDQQVTRIQVRFV